MTANHPLVRYGERANTAACPACRTVNMLGMMCAAAAEHGTILAFVGHGYGGDWPDPREAALGAEDDPV